MVQNLYSKMHLASCTNTHHDVTNLINHEMVKNSNTWISEERNITFLQNKEILNLWRRWHIWRSYHFVVEIAFNCYTHRMEKIIEFPDAELYAESFEEIFIKIKYSRSSLDPENSCCGHQQPYIFFSFSISEHLPTPQEN